MIPHTRPTAFGYVLRAHVIRQLIAAGIRRYDFLVGEDSSKLRWAAQPGHYVDLQFAEPLTRASLYLHLIHSAGKSKETCAPMCPECMAGSPHGEPEVSRSRIAIESQNRGRGYPCQT